jgi:DNA-binding response OmpR family regulator
MRVLLVEDDQDLATILVKGFREQHVEVLTAGDMQQARLRTALARFSVIILDIMIPGGSGVDLCRELRQRGDATPILMLTARGGVEDRVAGLEAGADDYLPKPFAFQELVARVRALERRQPSLKAQQRQVANLSVDLRTREVRRGDAVILLTSKEWELLEVLVENQGAVVSRTQITDRVWDENHDPFTNVLEVLIRRLRSKIDDGYEPRLIHTVRGAGYRFGA